MYQAINEQIDVIGIYRKHQFLPKKFRWQQRVLKIDEVTLVNDVKDGQIDKRFYSVVAADNVYRLEFNRTTEEWKLVQVWVE